jgi:hypothetical protein
MEAETEPINYNDYIIRRFIHNDGFKAYYADDISKIIKIKNIRKTVQNFTTDEIVSADQRQKYNIITNYKYGTEFRRNDKIILLTKQGLTRLLCTTRATGSANLARFFNINVYEHRINPVELTTIKLIQDTFAGESMVTQYIPPNTDINYRIDLYFPAYRIAIECDEHNHTDRNPEYEHARETYIKSTLDCTFIRYNPHDPNFNIGEVLNQIYVIIKSFGK